MSYHLERTAPTALPFFSGGIITPEVEAIKTARDAHGIRGDELPCHPDPGPWESSDSADIEHAEAACGECPIRAECLALALAQPRLGRAGMTWGGHYFPISKEHACPTST